LIRTNQKNLRLLYLARQLLLGAVRPLRSERGTSVRHQLMCCLLVGHCVYITCMFRGRPNYTSVYILLLRDLTLTCVYMHARSQASAKANTIELASI